ncbi:hypothetical protein [Amycolatopsis sp. cmx-4-83]|uniref:hypothetical protein n=1 Tax=Amycolatopsis sp. cmx-4-83 TaxID=2790940 RepID=UPI00397BDDCF
MTTGIGPDDGADRYVVVQRKSVLFPEVVAASYRLHDLPIWNGRDAVDPASLSAAVEDAVLRTAFFCGEELNATLDRLLAAARARVEITRDIHASSRPAFGGRVHEDFRVDDESGRRELRRAVTAFADAARADLRISGTWGVRWPVGEFGAS